MTIDEYETIRLMDLENCTQESCAMAMNVARTTVQKIYEEARRKLADAIINGKELFIEGGEIRLCDGHNQNCIRATCRRLQCNNLFKKANNNTEI